jgi:hypothetical protein
MRIRSDSVRLLTFLAACGAAFGIEVKGLADESLPPPPIVLNLPVQSSEADLQSRFLLPGPGKVPVQLESDGPPLLIGSVTPWSAPLCTTPCTLHLAPGGTPLHLGGPGRLESQTILDVRPDGQRVLLYSYSRNRVAYSALGIAGGSLLALMGAMAFIPTGSDDPSISGVTATKAFGGIALGIGVGTLTASLLTIKRTRTGVKRIEPLPPPGPPFVARSLGRAQQPW